MEDGLIGDREYKKKIGVPLTKTLYYKEYEKMTEVKDFRVIKVFSVNEYWAVLELELADGRKIRIHSMYFAEMQDRKFARQTSVL